MASSSQLSPRSEEFRRVEYLLKLSLRASRDIHDVSAWVFTSAQQAARFQERTRGMQVLHAWLPVSQLDQANTLEALHARGFNFPNGRGMVFTTGTLSEDLLVPDGRAYRLLLCQIGVGRSFVSDEPDKRDIPPGFDSIFLARRAQPDGGPQHVYRHEYVLMDPLQCIPLYLVQYFGGPPPPDGSSSVPMSLTDGKQIGLLPPNATVQALYDRYDFFDPIWYVPVSVRDKMVGSHSTGEAAQHKLISIGDAYDAALSESLKPDTLIAQRQGELRQSLRAVDAKLREVNRNSAEVEELIYKTLQDALFQLQDLTQEKLNVLLSEEVELRRQLEHVDWTETFLDQEREEATPVDFLNAWKCHVQLRADIARSKLATNDVLARIFADLSLTGDVRIVAGTSARLDDRAIEADEATPPPPPQPQPQRQGEGAMTMQGGGADGGEVLDVSRAWAEALQLQVDLNRSAAQSGNTRDGAHGKVEMPPTPPSEKAARSTRRGANAQQQAAAPPAVSEFEQFLMTREAARKIKAAGGRVGVPAAAFEGSRIVGSPAPSANAAADAPLTPAQRLAMCLPYRHVHLDLMYASWRDPRSIPKLLEQLPRHEVQDGANAVTEVTEPCPTVLLIKANGRVFGGYASDTWRTDSRPFGDNRSFLFSLDEDVKIPFHGREAMPPPPDGIVQDGARPIKFGALYSNAQTLQFGVGDLVLTNDFQNCSSELEHSFGCGLQVDSERARTLLAGATRFTCDEVECWAVRDG